MSHLYREVKLFLKRGKATGNQKPNFNNPVNESGISSLPLDRMKTTRLSAPKNDLQIDLSEQDILHTIDLEPEQLQQFEKLTNQELNDFRFLLPFGQYMFALPDTNFIKQAIRDNALRIEYYDPY